MWNILVVDDHLNHPRIINGNLLCRAICVEAVDGIEALVAIQKSLDNNTPFDAVLLDTEMPRMNGVDVLKIIRELEVDRGVAPGQGVPVIMVTGHPLPVGRSFVPGCDDYVVRPIDAGELVAKLTHWAQARPQQTIGGFEHGVASPSYPRRTGINPRERAVGEPFHQEKK